MRPNLLTCTDSSDPRAALESGFCYCNPHFMAEETEARELEWRVRHHTVGSAAAPPAPRLPLTLHLALLGLMYPV